MSGSRSLDDTLRGGLHAAVWWAVLSVGLVSAITAYVGVRTQTARHLDTLARSLAYQLEAAVSFHDAEAAREALQPLMEREGLALVRLTLPQGQVFVEMQSQAVSDWRRLAQWGLERVLSLHTQLTVAEHKPELGEIEVQVHGNAVLGLFFAYLGGIALAMGFTALAVAWISRRVRAEIGRPIEALQQLTRQIRTERTFERRAPPSGIDEIDALAADFNALLDVVQAHEDELLHKQSLLLRDNESLSHEVYRDPLTGLSNRAHFLQALKDRLAQHHALAVLFIDADGLKPINDLHGHAAGDALLQAVGQRIRAALRETDLVARLGGDEYAVLISPITHEDMAAALAEKIQTRMQAPLELLPGLLVEPSVSIGWALHPDEAGQGSDAEALLARADAAMYKNKRERRRERPPHPA